MTVPQRHGFFIGLVIATPLALALRGLIALIVWSLLP